MEIKISKCDRMVSVDYSAFAENVKDYVIRYGLTQILNDAASSVPTGKPAEAWALVSKKLAALQSGEVRTRREGASPVEAEATRLALSVIKANPLFAHQTAKQQMEIARKYAPNFMKAAEEALAIAASVQLPDLATELSPDDSGEEAEAA